MRNHVHCKVTLPTAALKYQPPYFLATQTMCGALVDFLSTVPGNELSPAGVEAWRKLMGFLMKTTETELKRIEHQKQQEQK